MMFAELARLFAAVVPFVRWSKARTTAVIVAAGAAKKSS